MSELGEQSLVTRSGILEALTKALRNFGCLASDGGALAQAWMPTAAPEGDSTVLQTKGLPYCLVGKDLTPFGGKAETSDNVHQCNTSIYLRVKDAQACRVCSTILLPIFASAQRKNAIAVLEITQFNSKSLSYQKVFDWARNSLEAAGLFIPKQLETQTFEMQSHALSINFLSSRDSALGCIFNNGLLESPPPASSPAQESDLPARGGDHSSVCQRRSDGGASEDFATSLKQGMPAKPEEKGESSEGVSGEENGESPEREASRQLAEEDAGEGNSAPQQAAPSQGPRLSREDLEKHFGLGLKEAAARLGVCNTTLKRACRRYGIMKWPRRELLRVAKLQREASRRNLEGMMRLQRVPGGQISFVHPTLGTACSGSLDALLTKEQQYRKLQHAASSSLDGQALHPGVSPPEQNTMHQVGQQQTPTGSSPHSPAAEGGQGVGQWQGLAPAASRGGQDSREGVEEARRGSLGGLVDAIFNDPSGFGSILDSNWESDIPQLKLPDETQPMEGVVDQEDRSGSVIGGHSAKESLTFPEIPSSWAQDDCPLPWFP